MGIDIEKIRKEKPIKELLEFSIINIDKPSGMTSFEVDVFIMNKIGAKKTSHFGTLDPMVTGVLPIALNRACKLSNFFMHKDKTYIGKMHLHSEISEEELKEKMKEFVGKIVQLPPVRSAVKRQEREREVKRFEVTKFIKDFKDAEFIAEVEAGTYIRTLVHNLGEKINGAHMSALRRIKAGIFQEQEIVSVEKFISAIREYKEKNNEEKLREILIPGEIISLMYPNIELKKQSLKNLLTGKPIKKQDIDEKSLDAIEGLDKGDTIVCFCESKFIEVARIIKENEIIAKPEFVFN
ncbi:MAG: RNA-guided pseudouridylation complex pseudouridine synthase subunit Cbf5 [Candidatus Nanoarchaeia archaeon]